jgi:hypothetical protein
MVANVTTYGGEPGTSHWYRSVQHWQLHVDGVFVADTDQPEMRNRFYRIAEVINNA